MWRGRSRARAAYGIGAREWAARLVAVGGENWLFTGSPKGGKRAALLYSLINSCRLQKLGPFEYLRDAIDRVSTHPGSRVAELTPRGSARTPARCDQRGGADCATNTESRHSARAALRTAPRSHRCAPAPRSKTASAPLSASICSHPSWARSSVLTQPGGRCRSPNGYDGRPPARRRRADTLQAAARSGVRHRAIGVSSRKVCFAERIRSSHHRP